MQDQQHKEQFMKLYRALTTHEKINFKSYNFIPGGDYTWYSLLNQLSACLRKQDRIETILSVPLNVVNPLS